MLALAAFSAFAVCGAETVDGVEMLPSHFDGKTSVVIETEAFRLVINPDATARSLVVKATGEECLAPKAKLPVFASVQKRPFNNETRLVQMAKRTTYPANRVRRDGDILRIGFETAPYEAEVRVVEKAGYAAFEVVRFISNTVQERQYYHWNMDVPPVEEFRLLQLPVLERRNFGDWLNAEWDENAAVAVVGATPYMDVDNEKRGDWRLLRADALSGIGHGITNGVAAIAAGAGKDALLAQIEALENDYDLPRGVASRRNPLLNASIYWTRDISVHNVDEHVANMKKGGFRMALIFYSGMFLHGVQRQGCVEVFVGAEGLVGDVVFRIFTVGKIDFNGDGEPVLGSLFVGCHGGGLYVVAGDFADEFQVSVRIHLFQAGEFAELLLQGFRERVGQVRIHPQGLVFYEGDGDGVHIGLDGRARERVDATGNRHQEEGRYDKQFLHFLRYSGGSLR